MAIPDQTVAQESVDHVKCHNNSTMVIFQCKHGKDQMVRALHSYLEVRHEKTIRLMISRFLGLTRLTLPMQKLVSLEMVDLPKVGLEIPVNHKEPLLADI